MSQVSIPPEEDARLPVLEAQIETQWRRFRPKYVKQLESQSRLPEQIKETALSCISLLNDYQNRGLNPDQGREAIQDLIIPPQLP